MRRSPLTLPKEDKLPQQSGNKRPMSAEGRGGQELGLTRAQLGVTQYLFWSGDCLLLGPHLAGLWPRAWPKIPLLGEKRESRRP